jgi:hypothetical protein
MSETVYDLSKYPRHQPVNKPGAKSCARTVCCFVSFESDIMPKIQSEQIEQIKKLDQNARVLDPMPEPQSQSGPNCGFYALSIVLEYWKKKGKIKETLPARKRDIPDPAISLRQLGKQIGALDIREKNPKLDTRTEKKEASVGGVFRAEQLGEVAKAFKAFENSLIVELVEKRAPKEFVDEIRNAIDEDIPPIVAFDVEKGDPKDTLGGQHSHWGVVIGYYTEKECLHFLATHGHGSYYDWISTDLQKSNFALEGSSRFEAVQFKAIPADWIKEIPEGHALQSQVQQLKLPAWKTQKQIDEINTKFAKRHSIEIDVVEQKPGISKKAAYVEQDLAYWILKVKAP